MPSRRLAHNAFLLVALAVALFQAWLSIDGYGLKWLKASWLTRKLSSEQRAARFLIGTEGYQYIDFLRDEIPEDGAVVLPSGVGVFSHQSNLQFLLMPRGIPICPCDDLDSEEGTMACVQCLNKPGHYVLSVGDYPPRDLIESERTFVGFPVASDTLHGFYAPTGALKASTPTGSTLGSEGTSSLGRLLEPTLLLPLFLLGVLFIRFAAPGTRPGLTVLLGLPLGMGWLTFTVFLLGWMGIAITSATFLSSLTALTVAFAIGLRLRGLSLLALFDRKLLDILQAERPWRQPAFLLAAGLVGLLILSVFVISIGRSYSTYDGIANWGLKGYAIAEFDTVFAGADWGGHGLSYPQNIHLVTAFFRTLTGDQVPISKVIHPIFYAMLPLGTLYFLWSAGLRMEWAITAAAVTAGLPFLYFHATLGYANVIFSGYVVLAVLTTIEGLRGAGWDHLLLGGTLMGMAAWTRPEGIYIGGGLLLILVVMEWLRMRRPRKTLTLLAPFLLIAITWQSFGGQYQAQDQIGKVWAGFLSILSSGSIPTELVARLQSYAVRELGQPSNWGLAWLAIIPAFLLTIWRPPLREDVRNRMLWGSAIGLLLLLMGMLTVAILTTTDFAGFLDWSFNRAVIPAMVLLLIAAFHSFGLLLGAAPDQSTQDLPETTAG